jgi:hypothetical protein
MNKAVTVLFVLISLIALVMMVDKPTYAVAPDSWTEKAPMHIARGNLGVASVNGKIYAIGGLSQNDASGQLLGTNEEYDPTTNTWTTKTPMPTPRKDFAIAVYQNKIYCIGGVSAIAPNFLGPGMGLSIDSSANEVYDPATDSWTSKASCPIVYGHLTANVVGGKIYIIAGDTAGEPTMIYDPSTDLWIEQAMNSPTTESWNNVILEAFNQTAQYASVHGPNIFASATVGDAIYAVPVGYRGLLIYDSLTGNWSVGAPPPSEIVGSAAAAVTTGALAPKQIYFQGSIANYAYSPDTDSWQIGVPMPTNRTDFGVVSLNDQIYVIGGYTNDVNSSAANEQYTPIGYGTPYPTCSPSDKSAGQAGGYLFLIILTIIGAVIIVDAVARARKQKTVQSIHLSSFPAALLNAVKLHNASNRNRG